MKKAMFTLAILVATTSFAVNPVNVNSIKNIEIKKAQIKESKITIIESKNVIADGTWEIKCNGSGSGITSFVYEGTASQASSAADLLCGSAGWQMKGLH